MRFATITVLALVMLQAANTQRILKLSDTTDDCVAAVHSMQGDVEALVQDIQKGDFTAALGLVMGKLIPEATAVQAGGMDCLLKVLGEFVGPSCVADVEKLVGDVQRFAKTKNVLELMAAFADFQQGMKDCHAPKLSLESGVYKNSSLVPEVTAVKNAELDFLLKVLGLVFGETCEADVEKLIGDVQRFATTANVAELLHAFTDFQQGMKDCHAPKLSFKAVDCEAELKAILDAYPVVMGHLQTNNFMALISDLTSLKPHIDNIKDNCVAKTDACNAFGQTIQADLENILGDVSGNKNKPTLEGHSTQMADTLYDWRQTCFNK